MRKIWIKKLIPITIALTTASCFYGCGETKKETKNLDTAFGVNIKDIKVEDLYKTYEKAGLSIHDKPYYPFGTKAQRLEDDNKTNHIIVFGEKNVMRTRLSSSVSKANYEKFKKLSKLLFNTMIPEFTDYEAWLDYIIPIAMQDPNKHYKWFKNDVCIRVDKDFSKDEITVDIGYKKNYKQLYSQIDSYYAKSTLLGKIIELDQNGKIPEQKEINTNRE